MKTMKTELIDSGTKIDCPHCNSINCFKEDYEQGNENVSAYLCMACGYTTTSMHEKDSSFIDEYESGLPTLFKDLRFIDNDNKIWYPMILNFPSLGLVFPDGTSTMDWSWRAVPVIPVSEEEKGKYPIPGEEGKFYETKADMENSRLYPQGQFNEACKHLGIIVP